MQIHTLPILSDNYLYLLVEGSRCVAIDPGEDMPLVKFLDEKSLELEAIWCTHHHADHVGGVASLKKRWNVPVVASLHDKNRITGCDTAVTDGERFPLWGAEVTVLSVPGHTLGAVTYWIAQAQAAFTGDTLFNGGCGRLFEGTATQMWESLLRLRELPPDTRVFGGHEYTESNLAFAVSVEPLNARVRARYKAVQEMRSQGQATTGATFAVEKTTNPFLRADDPVLAGAMGLTKASAVEVFTALRGQKDIFRY